MKCDELQYERLGEANWAYPASTLVIRKQFVDEAIEEFKAENERLKKEIERCQRYHDAEAVKWLAVTAKTETENRRLKRALWMARAKNASYNIKNRQRVINTELEQERPDIEFIHHHEKMKQKWMNVERLCLKKAEEYK